MLDPLQKEELSQFIAEFADDQCSRELLLFLGRHPHTRFGRLVLVHTLSAQNRDIERTFRHLVSKGVVKTCAENGVSLYWLTEAEPQHSLVLHMAALNRPEWQLLLERVCAQNSG
jgi:hypothetical protein